MVLGLNVFLEVPRFHEEFGAADYVAFVYGAVRVVRKQVPLELPAARKGTVAFRTLKKTAMRFLAVLVQI